MQSKVDDMKIKGIFGNDVFEKVRGISFLYLWCGKAECAGLCFLGGIFVGDLFVCFPHTVNLLRAVSINVLFIL